MSNSDGADQEFNDSGIRSASGEWLELVREMRDEDGAVHDRTLLMVRGIVSALRTRRARRETGAPSIFGAANSKASA